MEIQADREVPAVRVSNGTSPADLAPDRLLVRLLSALIDEASLPGSRGGAGTLDERVEAIGIRRHWQEVLGVDAPDLAVLKQGAVGQVVAVGSGLTDRFSPGDLAVGIDARFAGDLDWAYLDGPTAMAVPEGLTESQAAVAPLLSRAVRAIRMLQPPFGATVGVVGLCGEGMLAVQCLLQAGARVLAVDTDPAALAVARDLGAAAVWQPKDGDAAGEAAPAAGCVGVILGAPPADNAAVQQAIAVAAPDARLVALGDCPETVPFPAFMEKRLTMSVAKATARDDGQAYESDLHLALDLLAEGRVRLAPLGLAHVSLSQVRAVVAAENRPHWLLLEFGATGIQGPSPTVSVSAARGRFSAGPCAIGVVGISRMARTTLLPRLRGLPDTVLHTILADASITRDDVRRRYGFERAVAEPSAVVAAKGVSLLLLLDRYALDMDLICSALLAGKAVLTEAPFVVDHDKLERVLRTQAETGGVLQLGFFRRFAPMVRDAAAVLERQQGRRHVIIRANAGRSLAELRGGRGEGGGAPPVLPADVGHFVDLARYLADAPITAVEAASPEGERPFDDVAAQLHFADGSLATLAYTRYGETAFSRESVEVFADGLMLRIDNCRELLVVEGRTSQRRRGLQDKGHRAMLTAMTQAMTRGEAPPIPFAAQTNTLRALLALVQALGTGRRVMLG